MRYFRLVVLVLIVGIEPGSAPSLSAEEVVAAPAPVSFAKELGRTFAHPRCINCHGFTTKGSAVAKKHAQRSRDCKSCHFPTWKAPKPAFSFTGISPEEMCQRIKRNTPDLAKMAKHLKKDGAIIWSLVSGRLFGRNLERAPPGNRKTWFAMIDRWIAGGRRCHNP
ncbi:MAG: hypothetical protein O7I42_16395 [Alphaproteobacteria bacterium]|nr:hypothetical protein [Alphaproteobacteria bacterium]